MAHAVNRVSRMQSALPAALAAILVGHLQPLANPIQVANWRAPTAEDTAMARTNPEDSVLVVYTVTPEQEAQFSDADGQASQFWSLWAGADSILLDPPRYCYPGMCGFTGLLDATVSVKAAGSSRGLYLLVTVRDDAWVAPSDSADWHTERLGLYFDKTSADTLRSSVCTGCLIGMDCFGWGFTSTFLETVLGTPVPRDGLRMSWYNDNTWSWESTHVASAALKVQYGMEVEQVQSAPDMKQVELFWPWETYCKGLVVGTQLGGQRFAFTVGYDDVDSADVAPDCLRWQGKDPFAPDASCEKYWGDLYLNPLQPPAVAARQAARAPQRAPTTASVAVHDLRGRRVVTSVAGDRSPLPAGCYLVTMPARIARAPVTIALPR